jgi:hypothetical protein
MTKLRVIYMLRPSQNVATNYVRLSCTRSADTALDLNIKEALAFHTYISTKPHKGRNHEIGISVYRPNDATFGSTDPNDDMADDVCL